MAVAALAIMEEGAARPASLAEAVMRLHAILQHSFTRFLLVGALNTLVGLSSIYLLLHAAGFPYWPATFFGNAIGAGVSYLLNKRFTFRSGAAIGSSLWKFLIVTLVCYAFSYWFGHLLAAALPESWADNAAVLIGSGTYTVTNYLGHRFFTFR